MSAVIRARGAHAFGYTPVTEMNGAHADMHMDFGILRMRRGDAFEDARPLEKAFLLVYGRVRLSWNGQSADISRANCFDESPTALHAPKSVAVRIECISDDCEINIMRTDNETDFAPRLYLPQDTKDEYRGAGLMREASTRIVRTIFDYKTAPYANLVLGEVIGMPGRWSSYPPHHHPQPEIYYYKTNPEGGFAYAELGEDVVKVHSGDTVCIAPGLTHPQCTPPGYALWYLWVIRHNENDPYAQPKYPTFVSEHLWVQKPDAVYFGDDGRR